MGTLKLTWNNAAVNASQYSTGQRAIKRIKVINGAYDAVGFTPSNDLPKSANEVEVDIVDNRVYQFLIQGLCQFGGPSDSGVPAEGITFACIPPTFQRTYNSVTVNIDLTDTDIHKVRVKLRKQSDNSIVSNTTAARDGSGVSVEFSGLTPLTDYWIEVEFYAIVKGVEVISSDSEYPGSLGEVCGTNAAPYQVSTLAPPSCAAPLNLEVVF